MRRIATWGLAALGLGLLAWTLANVPLAAVWAHLQKISPGQLTLLTLLNGLIVAGFGLRGWLFLRAMQLDVPLIRQMAYRLAAFAVSYFTPGTQFGGEPLHVHLLTRQHRVETGLALAAVALDKLIESAVNFSVLAAGIFWLIARGTAPASYWSGIFALGLAALPLLWLAGLCRGWRIPLHIRWLAQAEERAADLCRRKPAIVWQGVLLSIGLWGLMVLEYRLMMDALGLSPTPTQLLTALVAARVAFLVPTPGGLGALEAGQVWALEQSGLPPVFGLSLGLLIRGRDVAFGLVGLLVASRFLLFVD